MSEYIPDNWVIVKVNLQNDPHYRVLGGWFGGYASGDSWRLNSGITKCDIGEFDRFHFYGTTGSVYKCHPKTYKMNSIMNNIFNHYNSKTPNFLEILDEDNDWLNFDWIINA